MNIILTSSFGTVADELFEKQFLPQTSCRVAFITTAGNPYNTTPWITNDRAALERLGYEVEEIDIEGMHAKEIAEKISDKEIIFVAGGNTTYLAKAAKASGSLSVITSLIKNGRLYIGSSAGSILAGPSVEPFLSGENEEINAHILLEETKCLNVVPHVTLPHYPGYAEQNDAIEQKFMHQFSFIKLTDQEYRIY